MSKVQRSRGIRKAIRARVFGKPVQKYVTAGIDACGRMMREASLRRQAFVPGRIPFCPLRTM